MTEIARLLRKDRTDLDAIAAQFESMRRLWPDLKGLRDRRQKEAAMIRAADHHYAEGDMIRV
jgi:hypothetical protein